MTTLAKKKRLDAIDVALTPKEWAIRMADQLRSYPSQTEWGQTIAKGNSYDDSPLVRPFFALQEQAEKAYSGHTPDADRARNKLSRALRMEYHWLKQLIIDINDDMQRTGAVTGLKAALKLAKLETIVLQDAFGRTARKAAEWVKEYKTADDDEEESRQVMMEELAAYSDLDFGEKWGDSVPLPGGLRFRVPSFIENWVAEAIAMAARVYAYRAALQIVQDQHFDGHPILFLDVEAGFNESIKTLEEGMTTFNAYLKTRAEVFEGEWETDEEENDGIASAIPGEREGRLTIDIDTVRGRSAKNMAKQFAADWVKHAKDAARADILEETNEHGAFLWNRLREEIRESVGLPDDKEAAKP